MRTTLQRLRRAAQDAAAAASSGRALDFTALAGAPRLCAVRPAAGDLASALLAAAMAILHATAARRRGSARRRGRGRGIGRPVCLGRHQPPYPGRHQLRPRRRFRGRRI